MSNGSVRRKILSNYLFNLSSRNLMKKHEWEDLGYFNEQQRKILD